jgi:hypothetical protein
MFQPNFLQLLGTMGTYREGILLGSAMVAEAIGLTLGKQDDLMA